MYCPRQYIPIDPSTTPTLTLTNLKKSFVWTRISRELQKLESLNSWSLQEYFSRVPGRH